MSEAFTQLLLRHRHARAFALAAFAAAAVALLIVLLRMVWLLASLGTSSLPASTPMSVEQLVQDAESGATSLASWHLFGNALPMRDSRAGALLAPDTGLALILRGVFAGENAQDGRAIIADGNDADRAFAVGDEIVDGVTLDGVYADRITIARGGVIETLRLPRDEAGAPPLTALSPAAIVEPGPLAAGLPGMRSTAAPFVTPSVSTSAFDWNAATGRLGVDAQQLAREVSVLPVMEDGRFVGVRLQGGRDAALISKLGLQPDDVVTSVNGIELDSPARAAEVARSLAQASAVRVTVRRNGKPHNLSVNLQ